MKTILILIGGLWSITALQAQEAEATFEYNKTRVTGPISMLSGGGGNIAVLKSEDGLLVVDNGFTRYGGQLDKALESFGAAPRYVLNTHWHYDHTGANASLGEHATIVAHENVRLRLTKGATFGDLVIEPATGHALPDVTYQDGTMIHFGDQTVSAQHLPGGHTDGDSVIFFEPAHVVHTGDLMFAEAFPFIDPSSGGSVSGYIDNVATIINKIDEETIVVPGHGAITNQQGLKSFHAMLTETRDAVREMKASGKSLEQAQSAGLSPKWQDWGNGFINHDRWIAILWEGS